MVPRDRRGNKFETKKSPLQFLCKGKLGTTKNNLVRREPLTTGGVL